MDYFARSGGQRGNEATPSASRPGTGSGIPTTPGTAVPLTPGGTPTTNPAPIRIRRLPSSQLLRPARSQNFVPPAANRQGDRSPSRFDGSSESYDEYGRRRSFSDPERPTPAHLTRPTSRNDIISGADMLPTVVEERPTHSSTATPGQQGPFAPAPNDNTRATGRVRAASGAAADALRRAGSGRKRERRGSNGSGGAAGVQEQDDQGRQYEAEVTDMLDVIDPEVATLNTLNNVQNSLFIPYLGRWYSRQPTYTLSRPPSMQDLPELPTNLRTKSSMGAVGTMPVDEQAGQGEELAETDSDNSDPRRNLHRLHTIKSTMSGMSVGHNYAVLPHGVRLEGWNDEEMEELNDHVRHLLHSRRAGFKRSMRAFGKYVRKPMGFFVTAYAFTITFWGAAWVLFLIGWLHAGDRQAYFVEICDQILTAMLVVFGIGLFPWRCYDTYHMIYIAHYHYKVWKLRQKKGLPLPHDPNDLPDTDPRISSMLDPEEAITVREKINQEEPIVLPLEEQRKLKHHQDKMARSHTYYKPHETLTHFAFPVKLLITIIVLLDFHSFFQIALGGTTWGIYYRVRPKALTAVILACSITCNICGGILISVGDKRTRKKELFEQMFRQKRTNEAIKHIERKKGKPRQSEHEKALEKQEKLIMAAGRADAARKEGGKGRKSMDTGRKSMDGRKSLDAERQRALDEASRQEESTGKAAMRVGGTGI